MLTISAGDSSARGEGPALQLTPNGRARIPCAVKLWRSGIVWSVLNLIGGFGNFAFSALMARRLSHAEFGYSNTTQTGFITCLNLPLATVTTALVHYIAYFRGRNDEARLQGLLAGCEKFLLQATIAGSLLAVALAKPLGSFFDYRQTLMLTALSYILVNLWSNFGIALCQGMAWFKRLAIIGLVAVALRYAFGWVVTKKYPTAEMAVSAATFSFLANISLLYWRRGIFKHGSLKISPWNREFVHFLLVTGAYVAGNWFFISGQELVAQKYFSGDELGSYEFAMRWGLALPGTVSPFLLILFSSRSGGTKGHSDQRILLALYSVGLACGAGRPDSLPAPAGANDVRARQCASCGDADPADDRNDVRRAAASDWPVEPRQPLVQAGGPLRRAGLDLLADAVGDRAHPNCSTPRHAFRRGRSFLYFVDCVAHHRAATGPHRGSGLASGQRPPVHPRAMGRRADAAMSALRADFLFQKVARGIAQAAAVFEFLTHPLARGDGMLQAVNAISQARHTSNKLHALFFAACELAGATWACHRLSTFRNICH